MNLEGKMRTYFAVTGVLRNKNKILLLRKALDDRNYPGKWSFCSGFVREFESAEHNVLREIKEETGLKAKILKKGKIVEAIDRLNLDFVAKEIEKQLTNYIENYFDDFDVVYEINDTIQQHLKRKLKEAFEE